jgi:methylitaconate Delta-isomerase
MRQAALNAFGSPDGRQIQCLGAARFTHQQVAYVRPSTIPDAVLNYTFGYVSITQPMIDHTSKCGNTAAAVGPFALLRGLIEPQEPVTRVRIYNTQYKEDYLG